MTDDDPRNAIIVLMHDNKLEEAKKLAESMVAQTLEARPWDPQRYGFWCGVSCAVSCVLTARQTAAERKKRAAEERRWERDLALINARRTKESSDV